MIHLNTSFPTNPYFVVDQYNDLYQAFCNDPSKANAQALLQFIYSHSAQLETVGEEVDFQPYKGATIDECLQAIMTALICYLKGAKNEGAVMEFAGDVDYMIGKTCTPSQVEDDFLAYLAFFETDPSEGSAQMLQWILSVPGFENALKNFAPNEKKFLKEIEKTEAVLAMYLADPSDPHIQAKAKADLQKLAGDLIQSGVIDFLKAFEKYPSAMNGTVLEWLLSVPGFLDTLKASASNPEKFLKDVAAAEEIMANYLKDPSNPNLQRMAEAAMQTVLGDLNN